ncbi:MAG: glycosyltransferase [Clostridia bacterium]|nr:glycosyltransferase [Clostridia bacterium]
MTEKISVIVPVYNSEKTLADTCRAILNSSYENIELILVDDGSSDTSASVIQTIANKDSRVITISKENGGPSSARNEGIRLASGKYLAFCDADDIPDRDMYARLYERLLRDGADLALCDIYSERNASPLGFPWQGDRLFSGDEVRELIALMIGNEDDGSTDTPVWGSVCRGLYRTDFVRDNQVLFPEDIDFAEDLVFSVRYLKCAGCVSVIDEALYTYRDRDGSIMNSYFSYKPNMLDERIRLVNHLSSVIIGLENYDDLKARLFVSARCYYHECVGNAVREYDRRGKRECLDELSKILRSPDVRCVFTHLHRPRGRRRIVYFLIRHRLGRILYFYYKRRFAGLKKKKD